ncbi:5-formyltetrahydrofolate cyclo-ligase [Algihabitans albus]|uniref:5-formyltetrahydrofolate cyclo-ligase n=1 Tax=Algihabitans albus TaxID=2164067 RepID=UPI000E5C7FB5|nr:5-formyltetrahydrofolate cyclo-ligase [Algihabitans albus]
MSELPASSKSASSKTALRATMAEVRRRAAAAAPGAAEAVRERALTDPTFVAEPQVSGSQTGALILSAYWPMRDELDPRPLMLALAARAWKLCLPVVERTGAALTFRAWVPGDPLVEARFGTQIPSEGSEVVTPDVLLVPLLAFDRRGYRLGYGGGFYDRTLADLRSRKTVTAMGLAYAGQEVEAVPTEPTDQRLDALVTERGLLSFT